MKEFNTEVLKGKISLSDYMQFMFGVYEQNKRIENKLDIIIGKIAKLEETEGGSDSSDSSEEENFVMGMINNVMEGDPEVKKAFGSFFGGKE